MFPDLTGAYYFIIFGIICGVLGALGIVGFVVWFIIFHVQIV